MGVHRAQQRAIRETRQLPKPRILGLWGLRLTQRFAQRGMGTGLLTASHTMWPGVSHPLGMTSSDSSNCCMGEGRPSIIPLPRGSKIEEENKRLLRHRNYFKNLNFHSVLPLRRKLHHRWTTLNLNKILKKKKKLTPEFWAKDTVLRKQYQETR